MTPLAILQETRKKIEAGWCQGDDKKCVFYEGKIIHVEYCLIGAIREAAEEGAFDDYVSLVAAQVASRRILILANPDMHYDPMGWNDTSMRTKEEVLAAVDRAIVLARREENYATP